MAIEKVLAGDEVPVEMMNLYQSLMGCLAGHDGYTAIHVLLNVFADVAIETGFESEAVAALRDVLQGKLALEQTPKGQD